MAQYGMLALQEAEEAINRVNGTFGKRDEARRNALASMLISYLAKK